MTDPFKLVQPGKPIKLHHMAWNRIVNATKAVERTQQVIGNGGPGAAVPVGMVPVKNDTTETIERFSPMEISGPVREQVSGSFSRDEYHDFIFYKVRRPTKWWDRDIVVMSEEMAEGETKLAWIYGIFSAEVMIEDDFDQYCGGGIGEDKLISSGGGPIRIITKDLSTNPAPCTLKYDWGFQEGIGKAAANITKDNHGNIQIWTKLKETTNPRGEAGNEVFAETPNLVSMHVRMADIDSGD